MSDINTVTLTGRLGGKPEIRYTPRGTPVGQVSLAVAGWDGENETTSWIGLTFWGKLAVAAEKNLDKGRKIAVSGHLRQEEWEDKETGKTQRKTRVVVDRWTFADGKKTESTAATDRGPDDGPPPAEEPGATVAEGEEDIPF